MRNASRKPPRNLFPSSRALDFELGSRDQAHVLRLRDALVVRGRVLAPSEPVPVEAGATGVRLRFGR